MRQGRVTDYFYSVVSARVHEYQKRAPDLISHGGLEVNSGPLHQQKHA